MKKLSNRQNVVNYYMKKTKQGMGHIPSNEDRDVFQKRAEYFSLLHPIGIDIVMEFERDFVGNNLVGYSFATILESLVNDYELWLKSPRSYTLDHWFSLQIISNNYNVPFKMGTNYCFTDLDQTNPLMCYSYLLPNDTNTDKLPSKYPLYFNDLINKDSRYKQLRRSDLKPSPITSVIGFSTTMTTKSLIGAEDFVPGQNPVLSSYAYNGGSNTSGFAVYKTCGYLRDFIINAKAHTPVDLNQKYSVPAGSTNPTYVNAFSPNDFLTIIKDVVSVVRWLESENNNMNIKGNLDGITQNEYEKILSEQLTYLNQINDLVQQSLINEKIEGQNLKNSVTSQIESAKVLRDKAIAEKRANIKLLKETLSKL